MFYVDPLYRGKKKIVSESIETLVAFRSSKAKYKNLRKELTKNKLCQLIAFACAVYIVLAADPFI